MSVMTVFDPQDLERLAADVAHRPFMVSFAQKYSRLLPQRVARIMAATDERDSDQAMDATLSLRVASSVVGTLELVDLARALESCLRAGDLPGAGACAALLPEAAKRADHALTTFLATCHAG